MSPWWIRYCSGGPQSLVTWRSNIYGTYLWCKFFFFERWEAVSNPDWWNKLYVQFARTRSHPFYKGFFFFFTLVSIEARTGFSVTLEKLYQWVSLIDGRPFSSLSLTQQLAACSQRPASYCRALCRSQPKIGVIFHDSCHCIALGGISWILNILAFFIWQWTSTCTCSCKISPLRAINKEYWLNCKQSIECQQRIKVFREGTPCYPA